ncbi:hypothetical protein BX666DRAFT_1270433 [Dichotomocladium elegans]|nr:hypothetical protein BX666DRAFT_1270433 [Dichotomocladium elegans]
MVTTRNRAQTASTDATTTNAGGASPGSYSRLTRTSSAKRPIVVAASLSDQGETDDDFQPVYRPQHSHKRQRSSDRSPDPTISKRVTRSNSKLGVDSSERSRLTTRSAALRARADIAADSDRKGKRRMESASFGESSAYTTPDLSEDVEESNADENDSPSSLTSITSTPLVNDDSEGGLLAEEINEPSTSSTEDEEEGAQQVSSSSSSSSEEEGHDSDSDSTASRGGAVRRQRARRSRISHVS